MIDADSDPDDQPKGDPEVTLGMASLLGIFFGLVVLCGAFFGFGYSVGKRYIPAASTAAKATKPVATALIDDAAPTDQPSPDGSQTAKPSADGQELRTHVTSSPANPSPAKPTLPAASLGGSTAIAVAPASQPNPTAPRVPAVSEVAAPARLAERSPSRSAFPDYMVQIAAISRPADGDALIAALRKRGYNVSAYTEPQDKLLHVQIGPFAARSEANAMRQKLLADGYNAIIK